MTRLGVGVPTWWAHGRSESSRPQPILAERRAQAAPDTDGRRSPVRGPMVVTSHAQLAVLARIAVAADTSTVDATLTEQASRSATVRIADCLQLREESII